MATADTDLLAALLADLMPTDPALTELLTQISEEHGLRRALSGDPDDVPPVSDDADVYVQRGELYALGTHRLLCGDATDLDDVARLLDRAAPTLLATDERTPR